LALELSKPFDQMLSKMQVNNSSSLNKGNLERDSVLGGYLILISMDFLRFFSFFLRFLLSFGFRVEKVNQTLKADMPTILTNFV